MSWRTTGLLFLVVVLLAGLVFWQSRQEEEPTPTPTPENAAAVRFFPEELNITGVRGLGVRRTADGAEAFFERDAAGNWTRTVPTDTVVLSTTMDSRASALVNTSGRQTLGPGANPLSVYGLEPPTATVTLVAEVLSQTVTYTIAIGDITASGISYYVQIAGDERVHVGPQFVFRNLMQLIDEPPLPEPTPTPMASPTISGTATITATLPVTGTFPASGTPPPTGTAEPGG